MSRAHSVSTRVTTETLALITQIETDFGPKPAAIANMAMEDFCPRYIAAKGKPKHTEFLTQVGVAIEEDPHVQSVLEKALKEYTRGRRKAA